tara:strand:- start:8 stop:904 length:897 start_codon:yes stop_codon:yes gene_type:complete
VFKYIIHLLIAAFLFKILILFKLLGRKLSSNLCAYLFCKIGPHTKFNNIAKKNILYVWPKKKKKDINKIIYGMWNNIGRNFGELVHLKKYQPLLCKNTKIIGLKEVEKLISYNNNNNKGIIFFSAHYGNWELGPIILKSLKLKPLSIYRKSNNKFINFLIQFIRSPHGDYAPKGDLGAKKSFLWLRKGNSLAILMDQKLNEGLPIDFLGKPAYTAPFIAELAIRMNLDIVPIKFSRQGNMKNIITFYNKIKTPKSYLSKEEKLIIILSEINKIISKWITKNPEFWLWIHRRWSKDLYS